MRRAAEEAGSDPDAVKICIAAPAYVTDGSEDGLAHAADQCRWFGGMVGNHVADIVARYGDGRRRACPRRSPTTSRAARATTTTSTAAPGTRTREFVPDSIVDRFCLVGPPEEHVAPPARAARPRRDQFALYLQHDAKDATLARYGELVIPEVNEREAAKT